MSLIPDTLGILYPDFAKARRERRKIRRQCLNNLAEIGRSNELYRIDFDGDNLEFLNRKAEQYAVEADSLLKSEGSPVGAGVYKINYREHSTIEEELENCVIEINKQNYLSLGAQIVLIIFVVGAVSLALFLGIIGIGSLATELGNLV